MTRRIEVKIDVKQNFDFGAFERVFDETMPGFLAVGLEKVVGEAQANSPVYRGLFRGGIQNSLDKPRPVTFEGAVFSSVNYAPVIEGVDESGNDVEFGRRPGARFPNLGELRVWVERVISPPEEVIDEVTFLVGRAIARRGVKAKKPIGKAFNANREFINRQIDRGVAQTFDKL